MSERVYSGLFISEGSSDLPLADIVEALFLDHGVEVFLSKPDFSMLVDKVPKDVRSRLDAGLTLVGAQIDLLVVHRDADNAGPVVRRQEIEEAAKTTSHNNTLIPVIPVRMTEAWLLLDESAIRRVAGNPHGRSDLGLPKLHQVEATADPKDVLRTCILQAAEVTGRRREAVGRRFNEHRRQLLERLDRFGPITSLPSWQQLVRDVSTVAGQWRPGRTPLS